MFGVADVKACGTAYCDCSEGEKGERAQAGYVECFIAGFRLTSRTSNRASGPFKSQITLVKPHILSLPCVSRHNTNGTIILPRPPFDRHQLARLVQPDRGESRDSTRFSSPLTRCLRWSTACRSRCNGRWKKVYRELDEDCRSCCWRNGTR
jgi:hypothetical protein